MKTQKAQIGSWFAMTLLVAAGAGCSTAASDLSGRLGGGTAGGSGTSAGASGGNTGDGGGGGSLVVGSTAWLTAPPVAPALVAPAGATIKLHTHAEGAQIYTCTAGDAGGAGGAQAGAGATTYSFVLKAPDAKLYDSSGVQVGTHGAGPSWTSSDGSVAKGTKVTELPAPTSNAISWLLLRVVATGGTGDFGDVTYVQRLSTMGGVAPATGCDSTTVGTDVRAGYSAEYYFYVGGAGAAWLAPPAGIPAAIAAPQDVTLKLHDHAIGTQIYACLASGGGGAGGAGGGTAAVTYAWVFKAPNAILYDATFAPVGMHGAGPSWTSSDGSTINGTKTAEVNSPLPDAISWLLLEVSSESGAGALDDIAFVQRLNTAGGQAPATGCDATTANTLARIAYAADYYFYARGAGPSGPSR